MRERVRSSLFLFFAGFVSSSMVFAVRPGGTDGTL